VKSLSVLVLLVALLGSCRAQEGNATTEIGLVSYGSYHGGDVDQVDLKSGNLFAKIPLFSLPQLGKLSLSMSMVINDSGFAAGEFCVPYEVVVPGDPTLDGTDCYPYFYRSFAVGPTLVLDQDLGVSITSIGGDWDEGIIEENAGWFNSIVTDASGAAHTMAYDPVFATTQVQHASDGSGYTYIPLPASSPNPVGTIYSPSGLQYIPVPHTDPVTGVVSYTKSIVDPEIASSTQNKIMYSGGVASGYPSWDGTGWQGCNLSANVGYPDLTPSGYTYEYSIGYPPMNCPNPGAITDSVGRQIPLLDPTQILTDSTSIANAHCPSLGVSNQSVTGVQTWTVPGPNSGTSTYTFCYTTITYSTNYAGGWSQWESIPGSTSQFVYYMDAMGTGKVVQSIILPNKTYWGFVYDSIGAPVYDASGLNPCPGGPGGISPLCPSPFGYGDVLEIIRPTGANTSYTYTNGSVGTTICQAMYGYLAPTRMVASRSITNPTGTSSTWTYNWIPIGAPGTENFYVRVTNPAVPGRHTYTDHYFTDPPNAAACVLPETSAQTFDLASFNTTTKMYEGGTLLKSVQTQYMTTFNAGYGGWPGTSPQVLSSLPRVVQNYTATATGLALTDTTTYGYSTLSNEAYGGEANAQPFAVGSAVTGTIYFDQPTSTLFQGVDGTTKESLTTYKWQLASESTPGSFASPTVNIVDAVAMTCTLAAAVSNPGAGCSPVLASASAATQNLYGDSNNPYNLIAKQQLLNGSFATTQSLGYDSYERVTSTKDANESAGYNGNTTSTIYTYSPTGVLSPFPVSITRPLMPAEQYSYDNNNGNLLSYTDVNSQTTTYTYDVEGRRTNVSYPDAGWTNYCYTDVGGTCAKASAPPYSVVTTTAAAPNPSVVTTTDYDGLGRPVRTKVNSNPAGPTYTDTIYDALGRTWCVSNPYLASQPSATDGQTCVTYDGVSRAIIQTLPDGNRRQMCYDGLGLDGQTNCNGNASSVPGTSWMDTADESGNDKQHISDGLGNLVAVMEQNPSGTNLLLETDYGYDILGNLTLVTQKGNGSDTQRTRSFTYDQLSRLITSTNPESGLICYGTTAGAAPTASNCASGYDLKGNLIARTDANAVTQSNTYDALDRLLSTTFSGGTANGTPSSCYAYDGSASSNMVGRLVQEWTQSFTGTSCPSSAPGSGVITSYKVGFYDPMGRVLSSQQCILTMCNTGGVPFQISQMYDLAGHQIQVKQAAIANVIPQIQLSSNYDGAGQLNGIQSSWDGNPNPSNPLNIFSAQSYVPAGIQTWKLGNYLTFQKTYDQRFRPTSVTVTHP
jgi:YD repeat-containing protein